MLLKLFVWGSIVFLIGTIALVTYLTFAGNYKSATHVPRPVISKVNNISKAKVGIAYSMNQIDSITAADNYSFTSANAVDHPLSEW